MAKLSEIHRLIGNYIELHGDKDVTSISTHCGGGRSYEYTFNLHDIHTGKISTRTFSGADKLNIPK